MFYCENCRKENDWPTAGFTSTGKCEMCGKGGPCYDVPSGSLPKKDDVVTHDDSPPEEMDISRYTGGTDPVVTPLGNLQWIERKQTVNTVQVEIVKILQQAWRNEHTGELTWEDVPTVIKEE